MYIGSSGSNLVRGRFTRWLNFESSTAARVSKTVIMSTERILSARAKSVNPVRLMYFVVSSGQRAFVPMVYGPPDQRRTASIWSSVMFSTASLTIWT